MAVNSAAAPEKQEGGGDFFLSFDAPAEVAVKKKVEVEKPKKE